MGTKEKIAIWGASGHASVVSDILRQLGFEIAGFIEDGDTAIGKNHFAGVQVYSEPEELFAKGVRTALIAFGNNAIRMTKARLAEEKGFKLFTAVHPRATVASDVELGQGTVVMAGAVINPGSKIGKNVIINTLAGVDHDCTIEDGVHISPGVRMAGQVRVGAQTWVGIGATIIDHITIGGQAMIAAGAVVVKDVPNGVLAAGVPARVIRKLGSQ